MKTNSLLIGEIGTGKTHSLRTVLDAGKELFVLATEPGIESILGDTDEAHCHWHYVSPSHTSWDNLIENAELASTYTADQYSKMNAPNKHEYQQFIEVLRVLSDFKCDRCGKDFGAADEWDESRVLAVDGLTGLSDMAIELVCGAKLIRSWPEWQGGQNAVRAIVKKLTSDLKCNFILIAHMAREPDEVEGGTKATVSTLGQKLAPDIPKSFDEVIQAIRTSDGQFRWSTTESGTALKSRRLPWSDDIEPSFVQLLQDE